VFEPQSEESVIAAMEKIEEVKSSEQNDPEKADPTNAKENEQAFAKIQDLKSSKQVEVQIEDSKIKENTIDVKSKESKNEASEKIEDIKSNENIATVKADSTSADQRITKTQEFKKKSKQIEEDKAAVEREDSEIAALEKIDVSKIPEDVKALKDFNDFKKKLRTIYMSSPEANAYMAKMGDPKHSKNRFKELFKHAAEIAFEEIKSNETVTPVKVKLQEFKKKEEDKVSVQIEDNILKALKKIDISRIPEDVKALKDFNDFKNNLWKYYVSMPEAKAYMHHILEHPKEAKNGLKEIFKHAADIAFEEVKSIENIAPGKTGSAIDKESNQAIVKNTE
jgi:hypothetical protein